MNNKLYALVMAVLLLATSCGDLSEKWEYQLDNPLETEMNITVDGKDYVIPAKTVETIKLAEGKHSLTYNGTTINFLTKVNSNVAVTIINPTLSNYLFYADVYVSEKAKNKNASSTYAGLLNEYDSEEGIVELPVVVRNSLFIEQSLNEWKYGINDKMGEKIMVDEHTQKKVVRKVYREADFREEFAEDLPTNIVFSSNKMTLNQVSPYALPVEALKCDCEAANQYMEELGERLNAILDAPENLTQQINLLAHGVLMDQGSLNQECAAQYNPGVDDTSYKEAIQKLTREMTYLTKLSTFIVK